MNHLLAGHSITPQEALRLYGSMRLAAHIEVFRRHGHNIHTEIVKQGGTEYGKYTLHRKESNEYST